MRDSLTKTIQIGATMISVLLVCGCPEDDRRPGGDASVIERDAGASGCVAPPGSVADDQPCTCDSDCMEGAVCTSEQEYGVPMGRCTRLCTPGDNTGCADGYVCPDFVAVDGRSVCKLSCTTWEECPAGALCGLGICWPSCHSDEHCRSGHCELYTGLCTDGTPPEGKRSLAPCVRDDECKSGTCSTAAQRCQTTCSTVFGVCPEGEECLDIEPGSEAGACFPSCETDADCADLDVPCSLGTAFDGSTVSVCG